MQNQQGMIGGNTKQYIQSSLDQSNSEVLGIGSGEAGGYILEENHSEGGLEIQFAHQLNRLRFKNQKIIFKLIRLLKSGESIVQSNDGKVRIKLEKSSKEIVLDSQEMVDKLCQYLQEMITVNQILSDFTFSPQQNQVFIKDYKQNILSQQILSDSNAAMSKLHGQAHYSYFIKNATVVDYDELIISCLIEEFLLLNSQERSSEFLTLDFSHTPQHLGLLDNLFNKLFLFFEPIMKPSNDNKQTYDIFLLLMYDDNINTNQDLNNNTIINQSKQLNNPTGLKSGFLSSSGLPYNSNQGLPTAGSNSQLNRFNQSIPPLKYKFLLNRQTQIPRQSVKNLVNLLDSNNDGKITVEDIIKFSHQKYIHFPQNVYEEMFWDITNRRSVAFEDQRNFPLEVDEIWAQAQMHYKLGPNHTWIENPRPYRKYWVSLLEAAGEKLPKKHDLPKLKIDGIKDLHQLPSRPPKFKATPLNKAQSCINIESIPKKQYSRPFRAEAGIVVNNTEYIQEVVQDYREQMSGVKEQEAFEKVVNLKLKNVENEEYKTVKFETKNYFNEAERLSKQPSLYKHVQKNPIYTFVPENFNFQIAHRNSVLQNTTQPPESFKENEKKGKQGIRFSKTTSWNMGALGSQEQDSISQVKEMEEMEEYEVDSLMKTQSIRLSTQRVGVITPQRGSAQIHKSSLPVVGQKTQKKGPYPYDIFDDQFYARKKQLRRVVTAGEKNRGDRQEIFITTFKQEDCPSLKLKLAQNEPITDPYNPVGQVLFREQHTPEKNQPYITRFKCEPLKNPFGVSEHDSRPREALEREQHEKYNKVKEDQKLIDEYMGKDTDSKYWIKYFKLADMDHNFVDQQRPIFLDKGNFIPPGAILNNLLRNNDTSNCETFKLFHRTLHSCDKNLALGQAPESKF